MMMMMMMMLLAVRRETAWGVAVYSDNRWGIVLRHVLVFTSNARGAAL